MKNSIGLILAIVGAAALIILYSALFSVYQTQQALVLRFGEPVRVIETPGLNAKIPLVDSVILIDKRILDLENPSQEVIAADQKRLVVDAFARYRIVNPLRFYQSVGTVEAANSRLATILNSALRRVLGESTFIEVVRDKREELMGRIREQVNREAANFGIDILDVRIRRADLPEANSQAVFQRMQTERQREASEIRAQGAEAAQTIRARSDRDSTIIVAEANATADKLRGEGEALRNDIFAQAYGQDKGFFDFYRSMQAYEASMKAGDTRMLLSPDSNFFRFFNNPTPPGSPPPSAPTAAAVPSSGTMPALAPSAGEPAPDTAPVAVPAAPAN
ncbi:protease modulator HflC [Ancylobacter pratisalsi]|uniref:Protein HflC n=1 Tax=Ancylobacter pratisalsi TaxID=1745854 RepID=A0A6P1YL49_9HYPH|nr:protease modulator HflC [Ancylobacter pratisalsi]QIB33421.1 protease modulator HflC [Ancylobacter pratisalsi]